MNLYKFKKIYIKHSQYKNCGDFSTRPNKRRALFQQKLWLWAKTKKMCIYVMLSLRQKIS